MPLPDSLLTAENCDLDLRLAAGNWPEDISGEFVVSAPTADPALPHALFGQGAMSRLSLRPGMFGAAEDQFAWRTAIIDSPSQRLLTKAPDSFLAAPFGYTSPLGIPNMANTAPLPWGDRLFATWDVGRPVELNPFDLSFMAEVGHRDSWGASTFPIGEQLPFYFTSAHPVVDPFRHCLWTVKLSYQESAKF